MVAIPNEHPPMNCNQEGFLSAKALIGLAVIAPVSLSISSAIAHLPVSAQEHFETTELNDSLKQHENGKIVLLPRPEFESDAQPRAAMNLPVPAPLKNPSKTCGDRQRISTTLGAAVICHAAASLAAKRPLGGG